MVESKLLFVSGLLLAGAAVFGTHWYDRAKRAQDAIQYMVEDELDDADEALKAWTQD